MNIGIIGLGARSQAYVINIPKFFSQHKIIAVCEKDKERLENYTEHYFKDGMPDKYTDFNELLKDERILPAISLPKTERPWSVMKGRHSSSRLRLASHSEENLPCLYSPSTSAPVSISCRAEKT